MGVALVQDSYLTFADGSPIDTSDVSVPSTIIGPYDNDVRTVCFNVTCIYVISY